MKLSRPAPQVCAGQFFWSVMQKKVRQYIALFFAVAAYYVLHEGAHLLCAVGMGAFETVRFMGIGVQVQIAA